MFSVIELTYLKINRSGFPMFMSKSLLTRKKATNRYQFINLQIVKSQLTTAKNSGTTPDLGPGSDV